MSHHLSLLSKRYIQRPELIHPGLTRVRRHQCTTKRPKGRISRGPKRGLALQCQGVQESSRVKDRPGPRNLVWSAAPLRRMLPRPLRAAWCLALFFFRRLAPICRGTLTTDSRHRCDGMKMKWGVKCGRGGHRAGPSSSRRVSRGIKRTENLQCLGIEGPSEVVRVLAS